MKKLLLINPVDPGKNRLSHSLSSRFQPLGLGILAALTPKGWDVKISDENFDEFSYEQADLVGITAYTPTANRAYEIAQKYKQKGIPVILGGIHASTCHEEAARKSDCIVIGEAESVWKQVISDFEAGQLKKIYHGQRLDLDKIPRPRRDLFHPKYPFASVQTSRGCPMDCDFCSVSVFNGKTYRQRPVEDVLDELEEIPQSNIIFVDDNIIGHGKKTEERAITLFRGMIDRGIKKHWWCFASLNFADNEEVLKYASASGCKMVFIGIEAEKTETLETINKKMNISRVTKYEEIFRKINKHGLAVMGGFIFGLDNDTPEDLKRRTDYMMNSGVNVIQITCLTPLPGTRLFTRLEKENRLIYKDFPGDWNRYDMTEVVFRPRLMSPEQLEDRVKECVQKVYSKENLRRLCADTLKCTKDSKTATWSCFANMTYKESFGHVNR